MKIEKLPSGSYRVRKQINGKRHTFTFDHKPTQKEIFEQLSNYTEPINGKTTFKQASESYIDIRSNTLSPSTIREYKGTIKRLSDSFIHLLIDDITTSDVQREINALAKDKSPKTVRNYHGFISSVLGEFRPDLSLHTHLPMKDGNAPYIPSTDDINALLDLAKGTEYEVPLLLACASMRRGEICALTMDDIEGNIIHVTKDMVLDINKKWVIKPPKTLQSIRDIYVPDRVIEAINRNGLYTGHPSSITDWMDKAEKKLGLQHFSLHKCRHYFASKAHEQGISDADIMKAGGWKTDHVMKNVYRHSLAKDNSLVGNAIFKDLH